MDRASRTLAIVRTGIGYDRVDVDAATARGIAVCNTPDAPTVSTAEHAIALILAVTKGCSGVVRSASRRRRAISTRSIRRSSWKARPSVWSASAGSPGGWPQWHESLGMEVVAFDPFLAADSSQVQMLDTLDQLLANRRCRLGPRSPHRGHQRHLFDTPPVRRR